MNSPTYVPFSGHNKLSALLVGPHYSLVDKAGEFLKDLFEFKVPEGYEDEAGFHLVPVKAEARPTDEAPVWLGEDI